MPDERPIIMSMPSIRAILDGNKTQTRRVIRPQPESRLEGLGRSCPYGRSGGDLLWIRETFRKDANRTIYRAEGHQARIGAPWKSPIFMRRDESRITLCVTSVNVERVADIIGRDVLAEGVTSGAIDDFRNHWDQLNAGRGFGWDENPWVWVVEFELLSRRRHNA